MLADGWRSHVCSLSITWSNDTTNINLLAPLPQVLLRQLISNSSLLRPTSPVRSQDAVPDILSFLLLIFLSVRLHIFIGHLGSDGMLVGPYPRLSPTTSAAVRQHLPSTLYYGLAFSEQVCLLSAIRQEEYPDVPAKPHCIGT